MWNGKCLLTNKTKKGSWKRDCGKGMLFNDTKGGFKA